MGQRLQLQNLLEALADSDQVYFQPPNNVQMQYPCIVYKRAELDTLYADNAPYRHRTRYLVTIIDEDPDSELPEKVANLPLCRFQMFYVANNLNHDVYALYY